MQNTIFSTLTPCTHYFLLIRSEDVCWPHLTSFPLDQCLDQIYSLCLKVMQQRSVIHLNTLKVFFCFTFFGCKYCVLFCTSFCQLIRIHMRSRQNGWSRQKVSDLFHLKIFFFFWFLDTLQPICRNANLVIMPEYF